jgi:CRISPR-associated protein (TIGR02584 family)
MLAISKTGANKKVLIAVTGMSPAILTETVWALAQQEIPWIPDQVIAITTRAGEASIKTQLLDGGGWSRLRSALAKKGLPVTESMAFGASDSIRVIGDGSRDYEDIATPEESGIAADFLLGVLRQYTEQPDTEIMASIAGRRKTMSALMMSCISLLGRTQDRVCHVLIEDAFIAKYPEFLFPKNQKEQKAAKVHLCEIPFVRVRGWYEKEYAGVPPSYMALVNRFTQIAPSPTNYPQVCIDVTAGVCQIGATSVRLSPSEFALLLTLARRSRANRLPHSWYDLEQDLKELVARTDMPPTVDWFHQFRDYKQIDVEEFRKWASTARKKMRTAFDRAELAGMLIPSMKSKVSDMYPAEKIKILDVR